MDKQTVDLLEQYMQKKTLPGEEIAPTEGQDGDIIVFTEIKNSHGYFKLGPHKIHRAFKDIKEGSRTLPAVCRECIGALKDGSGCVYYQVELHPDDPAYQDGKERNVAVSCETKYKIYKRRDGVDNTRFAPTI